MCAVHAPWISCCNHFYLLNYVKPFFYPTGVSLFIFSLSASVMVTSFLIQRIQIKAQRRSWHGRFQSEEGMPPYSFFLWEIHCIPGESECKQRAVHEGRCVRFPWKSVQKNTLVFVRSFLLPSTTSSLVLVRNITALAEVLYKAFIFLLPLFQVHFRLSATVARCLNYNKTVTIISGPGPAR